MAGQLQMQLAGYARGAAIMPIPDSLDEYVAEHRTMRRRSSRAIRLGYSFDEIDRGEYVGDIYDINTSTPERQGRPMGPGYLEQPTYGDNPIECPLHHVYTYGVLEPAGRLVAYLWLYRSGDLAMVSSILGHRDHLDAGIMYLLFEAALTRQWLVGPGTVFYNLWNSGTEGLRFYKTRIGLREGNIAWAL
jgi:hypothetical protein